MPFATEREAARAGCEQDDGALMIRALSFAYSKEEAVTGSDERSRSHFILRHCVPTADILQILFFFKENGGVTRWRHPSRSNNSLRATLFSSIHEEEEEDFFTTPPGFAPLIKENIFSPYVGCNLSKNGTRVSKNMATGFQKRKGFFFLLVRQIIV